MLKIDLGTTDLYEIFTVGAYIHNKHILKFWKSNFKQYNIYTQSNILQIRGQSIYTPWWTPQF